MGPLLEPAGPLPATTYWRRRAVAVAGVLVLLLLVLRACGGEGDRGREAGQGPAVTSPAVTSPAAAPTTTAPTTAIPTSGAPTTTAPTSAAPTSAAPTTAAPTTGAGPAGCAAAALRVVASTDAGSYPLGSTARLTMTVTNTGAVACGAGLGQGSLELAVVSGPDRIWSSDDCAPGGEPGVETLAPGAAEVVGLPWALARSAPGCPTERAALRAGTYSVTARAAGITSAPVTFQLR